MESVAEHLEYFLGKIVCGWEDPSSTTNVRIVSFENQPVQKVTTYSTLGLSEIELSLPRGRTIRQELVISAHASFSGEEIANFMMGCAEYLGNGRRAVLRGEVINPTRPLIKSATVSAVYATNPTPFDDDFAEFSNVDPPVIFVFLVPITSAENDLLKTEGWNWFEDALEAQNPDIWDMAREEEITKS